MSVQKKFYIVICKPVINSYSHIPPAGMAGGRRVPSTSRTGNPLEQSYHTQNKQVAQHFIRQ